MTTTMPAPGSRKVRLPSTILENVELARPTAQKALQAWEAEFAEWLAKCPSRATQEQQVVKINRLYDRYNDALDEPLDYRYVRKLRRRAEFKEYYGLMQEGGTRAARRMMKMREQYAVAKHFEAVEKASAAGDYRGVFAGTIPMLDRIEPKKQELGPTAAIQVNLSVEQGQALAEAEAIPVEVEVVEE